jgi:hypothetical protein
VSEPNEANPKAPKRPSRRKPAMEPLGWDEIVSQPGMGGYLSFLNGPVPLPHLQPPTPEPVVDPVVDSGPVVTTYPEVITTPDIVGTAEAVLSPTPAAITGSAAGPTRHKTPGVDLVPVVMPSSEIGQTPDVIATSEVVATPDVAATAGAVLSPAPAAITGSALIPELHKTPGVISAPAPQLISGLDATIGRRPRIRKCAATHDGHSLGEEVLYQALWKAATAESAGARTIVIGWRGMSQLCRMTPKNCKINTQRLIRKLAVEVLSPYNTPESIGTTYRIFPSEAILRRRRAAGMEWVIRSRGVEFVDPATGIPVAAHLCGYVMS